MPDIPEAPLTEQTADELVVQAETGLPLGSRVRVLTVGPDQVYGLLQALAQQRPITVEGLPADAVPIGTFLVPRPGALPPALAFVVESGSFEAVLDPKAPLPPLLLQIQVGPPRAAGLVLPNGTHP